MLGRGNQLLALTMGAGKTIAAIATVDSLAEQGKVRRGFVFVPNTLKFQWLDEIRRVSTAPAQIIDGTREHRVFQYKHAKRFRYNIVNYEALLGDISILTNFIEVPDFIIADEATAIKSMKAKRSRLLKQLAKDVPYRFALTGQPVENRPEELYSIMQFVDRSVLGNFARFDRTFILRDNFGRPKRYRNMETLRQVMKPVMFRKSRDDIAEFLPQIINMEMPVALSPQVMNLYDFIASDCLRIIDEALAAGMMGHFNVLAAYGATDDEGTGNMARGEIMSRITCMRMLCDHPALLQISADNYDDDESRTGSRYAAWLKAEGWLDGLEVYDTKLKACVEQVNTILDEDPANRVVVFSFFKPMLRMIGKGLGIPHVYLTGDYSVRQRAESLDRFKRDVRVMLSSDAGQYGVDLPHVNYLISYDLPWSAGAFAQRTARIDRTSSLFPHVTVITMMSQGTIERRQFDMLVQKRKISEAWVDGKGIDAKGRVELTLESLRQFLAA